MNVFEMRRKKAQETMTQMGVFAMQVTGRENYFYLTGDARNVARLFLPQQGEPTIIVFEEEVEPAKAASVIDDIRGWLNPGQLMQHFFTLVKQHSLSDKKVGFCIHTNRFPRLQIPQIQPQNDGCRERGNPHAAAVRENGG